MTTLTPVDFDPFAKGGDKASSGGGGGARLTPVDYDPFAKERDTPVGERSGMLQGLSGALQGMENVYSAGEQRTSPTVESYNGRYVGPGTYGEDGQVYIKDANGNAIPTDQSKQVALVDPRDGQLKVFERSPGTEETLGSRLLGTAGVLSQGLATAPLARTPGLAAGVIQRRLGQAGEALRPAEGPGLAEELTSLVRGPAPAAEAAAPAAEGVISAAVPGQATRAEIEGASQRLGDYLGKKTPVPLAIASDDPLVQQAGAIGSNIPIVGSPIIRSVEDTIEGLREGTSTVAERLGGRLGSGGPEGAGELGKSAILDWIGPKSKAVVDKAYNAVDAAVDPAMLHPLDSTAALAAELRARNVAAGQPGGSPALNLVDRAIAKPEAPVSSELVQTLTAKLGNRQAAENLAAALGEKAAKAAPEGLTYHGIKDLRTRVGQLMDQGILPPDWNRTELKQMYGALSEDLGAAVERAGGTSGKALWERANKFAGEVAQHRTDLADIVGVKGDASSAQVFDRIVSAAKGNTRADTDLLVKAKHTIGADWDRVVSAAAERLGQNPQGIWQPGKFLKDWNTLSPAGKSALYGTGAHRQALEDINTISNRWPQLQKLQNPSGTARTAIGGYGAVHTAMHPLAALSHALPLAAAGGALYLGARKLAAPVMPQVLANPATAASAAAWTRAYERLVGAPGPTAMAHFMTNSRNLANTVNTTLGTNVSPNDFLKAVASDNKR